MLQGLSARVLYQMPSTAICWSVYEFFKFFITQREAESSLNKTAISPIAIKPPEEIPEPRGAGSPTTVISINQPVTPGSPQFPQTAGFHQGRLEYEGNS